NPQCPKLILVPKTFMHAPSLSNFIGSVEKHDVNPANTGMIGLVEYDWVGGISEIGVNLWLKLLFATD
ncbi:MAG: hypothetical protein U9N36_01640, partial [Euryarchaeota archaeon]|nr:hypothetical protein [Euryarchaeota archaeon]